MNKNQSISILIISFCCFGYTLGWWDVGHMLTVQVAQNQLIRRNQTLYFEVEKVLQALNPLSTNKSHDLVQAASWMDDIKANTGMNFFENWHYINFPIVSEGTFANPPQMGVIYNSPDGVRRCLLSLTSNDTYISMEKAMFLRILIHVVGDMHQPLHNTDYYNASFPNGDLGGNLINLVLRNGSNINLHSYWDSGALLFNPFNEFIQRPLNQSAQEYMENWAHALTNKYSRDYFSHRMTLTNYSDWSAEGTQYGQKFIYPFVANNSQITAEFENQARKIIQEQVVIGGYRLSDLLYTAFINNPSLTEPVF